MLSMWCIVLPTATTKAFLDGFNNVSKVIDLMAYTVLCFVAIEMAWVNIGILKALRTSGPATHKLHPAKKRASQTVCGIAFIAMICYTPVGVCVFVTFIIGPDSTCFLVPAVILLVSVASVAHPIFYLSTAGNLPCRRSSPTQ